MTVGLMTVSRDFSLFRTNWLGEFTGLECNEIIFKQDAV